jgi:hypothetical protein
MAGAALVEDALPGLSVLRRGKAWRHQQGCGQHGHPKFHFQLSRQRIWANRIAAGFLVDRSKPGG